MISRSRSSQPGMKWAHRGRPSFQIVSRVDHRLTKMPRQHLGDPGAGPSPRTDHRIRFAGVAGLGQGDGSSFGDVAHIHAVDADVAHGLRIDARADGIQHGKIVLVEIIWPQGGVLYATCPNDRLNWKLRDEVRNRERFVSLVNA